MVLKLSEKLNFILPYIATAAWRLLFPPPVPWLHFYSPLDPFHFTAFTLKGRSKWLDLFIQRVLNYITAATAVTYAEVFNSWGLGGALAQRLALYPHQMSYHFSLNVLLDSQTLWSKYEFHSPNSCWVTFHRRKELHHRRFFLKHQVAQK